MAKAVRTVIIDDLDDTELDPAEATTVRWSWRGTTYEFDTRTDTLSCIESDEQSITIGLLISVSRRVNGVTRMTPRAGKRPHNSDDPKSIRAWARANGHEVPARGRIPAPVRSAYLTAH